MARRKKSRISRRERKANPTKQESGSRALRAMNSQSPKVRSQIKRAMLLSEAGKHACYFCPHTLDRHITLHETEYDIATCLECPYALLVRRPNGRLLAFTHVCVITQVRPGPGEMTEKYHDEGEVLAINGEMVNWQWGPDHLLKD